MSGLSWKSLITLMTWLLLSGSAWAGTMQVLIRVLPEGSPVETIRITVTGVRGGGSRQTANIRNEKSVSFSGLRSGAYSVRAESPGFHPAEVRVELNFFARSDTKLVTVTLQRVESARAAKSTSERATVSVASLRVPPKARKDMEKAARASRAGKPEKAIKLLLRALETHPDNYQALNNLAVEYVRVGRVEEAIGSLQKSIELEPAAATSHNNLAELYLSLGAFEEALGALAESKRLEPANGKTQMLLGEANVRLQRFETALRHFESAVQIDEQHRSHLGMTTCYLKLGQPRRALEQMRGFVAQFPDDPRTPVLQKAISQLEKDLARITPPGE